MTRYKTNNMLGIGLMMLAMLLFEVMDAVAKWLVSADMSAIQVIAVRSWLITAMILMILAIRGELTELVPRKPLHHALRGCIGFFAPFAFFTSLKTLPLADATVVFFSSSFMLTVASALFLKETVGIHRWSAVVIGFGGVVIAMNPQGGGEFSSYLMVLTATVIYSMIFISGKLLSSRDSVISLVFSLLCQLPEVMLGEDSFPKKIKKELTTTERCGIMVKQLGDKDRRSNHLRRCRSPSHCAVSSQTNLCH